MGGEGEGFMSVFVFCFFCGVRDGDVPLTFTILISRRQWLDKFRWNYYIHTSNGKGLTS